MLQSLPNKNCKKVTKGATISSVEEVKKQQQQQKTSLNLVITNKNYYRD